MLFASFRGYRPSWVATDIVAGLLLVAIAIPEQLATARLAGMPPETGLYAFIAGSLALAVLGRNPYLSVGADSTIAPIFAATLAAVAVPGTTEYALVLGVVALVVGALLLAAGLARAEWISDLLSIPVTVGFLAGIAVQIVASQLPGFLGITVAHAGALQRIGETLGALAHTNPTVLALGAGSLAIIVIAQRVSPKVPGALIALVVTAVAVDALHLAHRVPLIGALRHGAPTLRFPVPASIHADTLLPLSAVVAIVCVLQTVTTLRSFRAQKGIIDTSGDIAATGAGSILAGLGGAFPVNASPPRSAILKLAGARSQAAGLVAVALTILVLAIGTQLFTYVPQAALASILIYIATRIFNIKEMGRILKESRLETVLVAASALLVVVLPINDGMLVSIALSLFYGVYVMLRPPCKELVHVPGTTIWWPPRAGERGNAEAGIVVFSPAAPLYFMNVRYIAERLRDAVERATPPARVVVIEGSGVIDIDYTGAHVFRSVLAELHARGIALAFARFSEDRALDAARRGGLLDEIGADHVFRSAEEAVRALA